jgi:uncharacterized protein
MTGVSDRVDLADLPVVDGHCHPFPPDPPGLSPAGLVALLNEGRPGTMTAHVAQTGYYRRALRALGALLGCEPTPEAVMARRGALGDEPGRRALAERRVAALLVDTGYPPDAMPLETMRRRVPCPIHEVFRVETGAQALLARRLSYGDFIEAFQAELMAAAEQCVGFKSIIAYRSGLAVRPWRESEVAAVYQEVVARVRAGGSPRLTEKPLLDTLFAVTLDVAAETDRPLQIHSGFGDPDIDLLRANPLHLRPILEDPRRAPARLVLLHMAYPYAREAAFMAAVWPQVYVDLSLVPAFLGPGSIAPLIELLSLAPASKLLYGSDVGGLPELFALVAEWTRAALGEALGWLVARDELTPAEARDVGRRILAANAAALYRLPAPA